MIQVCVKAKAGGFSLAIRSCSSLYKFSDSYHLCSSAFRKNASYAESDARSPPPKGLPAVIARGRDTGRPAIWVPAAPPSSSLKLLRSHDGLSLDRLADRGTRITNAGTLTERSVQRRVARSNIEALAYQRYQGLRRKRLQR